MEHRKGLEYFNYDDVLMLSIKEEEEEEMTTTPTSTVTE